MKICVECGASFSHSGRGRPAKRCLACRPVPADRPDASQCRTCGNYFPITVTQGPIPVFCSRLCSKRNTRPLWTPTPKPCPWCEIAFLPTAPKQAYCSKQCGDDKRSRDKAGWPRLEACAFCGKGFVLDPLARKQLVRQYCGQTCCRQANRDRRRAKIAGTTTERIDRNIVFERDEWVCGLCHQPVCRTLKWPDPMSKSLDHIIPISQGGSHAYGNVQCAHLCCNVQAHTKGTRFKLAALVRAIKSRGVCRIRSTLHHRRSAHMAKVVSVVSAGQARDQG